MKILFTADWHIKLGQKNVPREWQKNRYRMLFSKIHDLSKDVDVVINGGDIFDRVPTMEEIELYFEYISGINTCTYIYDGNHEATRKGKTFLSFLKDVTENINTFASVHITEINLSGIDIIPYCKLKTFKDPGNFDYNILCTHVRGEIPPHVKPEIDLSKLDRWDVVLAGDLHSYENSQRNILYPGSPLSTSFHRNPIKNGVIIFDTDTLEHEWIELGLPQLIRKTVKSTDEIVETDYDHTIYEIEGNMSDLANVSTDGDLIDKKVLTKNTERTLDLNNLTIKQELKLYLDKILKLDRSKIDEIGELFDDTVKETDLE